MATECRPYEMLVPRTTIATLSDQLISEPAPAKPEPIKMNESESLVEQNTRSGFFAPSADVDVIAHAGGNGQWPGETIYAFTQATKRDADVIELDVWGTADNPPVLVLMHSSDLGKTTERTQNLPFVTFAELSELNAAFRWSPDGGQTFPFRDRKPPLRIARLKEVFEAFAGTRINIEIKQRRPSIVEPLLDLIEESRFSTDKPADSIFLYRCAEGVSSEVQEAKASNRDVCINLGMAEVLFRDLSLSS